MSVCLRVVGARKLDGDPERRFSREQGSGDRRLRFKFFSRRGLCLVVGAERAGCEVLLRGCVGLRNGFMRPRESNAVAYAQAASLASDVGALEGEGGFAHSRA